METKFIYQALNEVEADAVAVAVVFFETIYRGRC